MRNRFLGKRFLLPRNQSWGTEASIFINRIIKNYPNKLNSYLEIGVYQGRTFEAINIKNKVAVDPNPQYWNTPFLNGSTYKCTSDYFFEHFKNRFDFFDISYVDGLHESKQTWKDIQNIADMAKPWSIILIDDTVPNDIYSTLPTREETLRARERNNIENYSWHGDIFKINLALQELPDNFDFRTINFQKNPRTLLWSVNGDWSNFPKNDMNLINKFEKISISEVAGWNNGRQIPNSFRPMQVEESLSLVDRHLRSTL